MSISRLADFLDGHDAICCLADALGSLVSNCPAAMSRLKNRRVSETRLSGETRNRTRALTGYPLAQTHTHVSTL